MQKIHKCMRVLHPYKTNERLVYIYLYLNSYIQRIENNDPHDMKYSYTISELSNILNIHRSNMWKIIKALEKKNLVYVVKYEKNIEVFV